MKKDIAEKRLEDHNDVFADIFNNLVFQGNQVLEEERLTPLPTEAFMSDKERVIRHPEEFLDAMSEVASDARYKIIKEQMIDKAECGEKEENVTMWKIEDEIENRGELLKIITLTRKKYGKGKSVMEVAEALEEEVSSIKLIYDLIEKYPDKDDKYILEQYQKV